MLQAASVFSDHMVLQRNKKIRVFGKGEDGSRIRVSLLGRQAEGLCREGKWMVILPEFPAADGAEMILSDGRDTICFRDVSIGEVWLAGGQSNMELELQNADGGKEILEGEKQILPGDGKEAGTTDRKAVYGAAGRVRFYYTPKVAYECEALWEAEAKAGWELFGSKTAARWSAAGFFFAERLAEELGVTVGVIGCNWGGTSASAWMSRERLLAREDTRSYVEEYESSPWVQKSRQEQIQDYDAYLAYHAKWEERAAAVYEKEPMMPFDQVQELVGICQYPGPVNCANFTRPCGLYEVMLKKLMPYTLGGIIYYQGESDDHKPDSYFSLFTALIEEWREGFGDLSLPFLLVQLPMHRYQHDPDTKSWCLIREAQMKAYQTVRNTGIAVIIDCGQFHEIHPRNKKPVGERLALQALYQVYHQIEEKEAFGPVYEDYLCRDGGMEISFRYAKEGFLVKGELTGFEVAGGDGVYYPATAVLSAKEEQKNRIFLSSPSVSWPVKARYLWTNYGEVALFGANGLPAAPFRTEAD